MPDEARTRLRIIVRSYPKIYNFIKLKINMGLYRGEKVVDIFTLLWLCDTFEGVVGGAMVGVALYW